MSVTSVTGSGDAFTVSVSGDIATFVTWKDRICSLLNSTVASYALFPDGQPRHISFKVEMIPDRPLSTWLLVGTAAKKQAAWMSVIGPPLIRIYWLNIPDTDAIKWDVLKPRLETWLDVAVDNWKSDLASIVILHLEPQSQLGSLLTTNRAQQQLSEKIRSLNSAQFPNRNVNCFTFQPFTNKLEADPSACDRLTASLHSLMVIQAIERVRRVEEIARIERERCCRAAMAAGPSKGVADEKYLFANMFLLEEAVARGYAALSLFDDALAHLDIIDAVLSQSAANCFCQAGRPLAVWIDECLAHPPSHVDCCRLVLPADSDWPTSPCPLMMLENGKHPLVETRSELLARQAAVIFRMVAANEKLPCRLKPADAANRISSYALQVAHSVVIESRQLFIGGKLTEKFNSSSQIATDAFVYFLYAETSAACQVIASSSIYYPISHSPRDLNILGHQALKSLLRLGHRVGYFSDPATSPNESEFHLAAVAILQMLRCRAPAGDGVGKRPENHSDKLARTLTGSSLESFVMALVELAESLLANLKASGFRRWARHLAFELADIYLQAGRANCKLCYSPLGAAEPLLLDCIGAWLSTRYTDLALVALKALLDRCYNAIADDVDDSQFSQLMRRRIWAMLHVKLLTDPTSTVFPSEIVSSERKITISKGFLSGNFLFSCDNIAVISCNHSKATVTLKIASHITIECCSVNLVLRLTSVMRPTGHIRRSYDSFGDDDHHAGANLHHSLHHLHQQHLGGAASLPPFRPEVSGVSAEMSEAISRDQEEFISLKIANQRLICGENIIEFEVDIPETSDYEAGALLHFVRCSINLFENSVNLLSGNNFKNHKPLIFRPVAITNGTSNESMDDKLREISLADSLPVNGNADKQPEVAPCCISFQAFSAEFALPTVFAGGSTLIFAVVDVLQRQLVGDGPLPYLIEPQLAVELDDEDALMLNRPIYDYSKTTTMRIPLLANKSEPKLPCTLARLTWRLPQLPPDVKHIRLLLSCTLSETSGVDPENRWTVASRQFSMTELTAESFAQKLLPKGAITSSSNETYM